MMPIFMIPPMRQSPYATNMAAEQLRCPSISMNAGGPGGRDFDQGVTASPAGGIRSSPPPLRASGNVTMLIIAIDGRTLSYDVSGAGPPIMFVAGLGEHGTYWMAQVAAFLPSRDLRSWRGGRERGPTALQSRAMGRGHAAAHRSPGSRPGASGRTFDRRCHCAGARSRAFRPCRVPRPRRNLGPAGRAIAQVVHVPQASHVRAGGV